MIVKTVPLGFSSCDMVMRWSGDKGDIYTMIRIQSSIVEYIRRSLISNRPFPVMPIVTCLLPLSGC